MDEQEKCILVSDKNNNNSRNTTPLVNGEKCYSLRPRTSTKPIDDESDWRPRGRSKRRQKQKPPPLSKYRRKTANARERSRMREINEAFEALRRAVPHLSTSSDSHNEKLTKITTLRLAMKYISALNQVLQEPDLESDGESLLSDYALTPTPAFSDHSITSEFSDNILSSQTFTSSDLAAFAETTSFVHPDFTTTTTIFADSSNDPCLNVPDLSHSAYVFDDLIFSTDFS
ncbi:uncharacterized protein LOC142331152 [Lycorma delicatula]|uniref:uncharacterized protein LOC142331152 n=1 Tax=Lycorma delicatula TaxID=130591 RepID=UPI003F50F8F3